MTPATTIDLGHVARDLSLPAEKVARTVELLDEGNTVPFITRYRKDHTGGLDEEQIRAIQFVVGKARQLAERKATILKTIEAQGKLTPELAEQIRHANTPKRLEDLYLPFKPKKQTLATVARERGLEPLAVEIYEAHPDAADLQARAATFLAADKELHSIDDVLTGVRHLIAERFSEYPELRGRLRRIFQRSGKIVCTKIEPPAEQESGVGGQESAEGGQRSEVGRQEGEAALESVAGEHAAAPETVAETQFAGTSKGADTESPVPSTEYSAPGAQNPVADTQPPSGDAEHAVASAQDSVPSTESVPAANETNSAAPPDPALAAPPSEPEPSAESATSDQPPPGEALPTGRLFEPPAEPATPPPAAPDLKKKKKKKKKVIGEHAFKDYYNYTEPLGKVPPHRMLAINRGDRAHAIRARIEADEAALLREAEEFLIAPNHPHAEFIRGCVRDSLTRLIIPSLEREIRREMTDRAEEHAVDVFVRNLRKLLLQPPVRGRRVLAIDPGFKSGSKMAALDEFGNVVGTGMIFVIGKDEEKRRRARVRLADMVRTHDVSVVAIGNGTGCRETEQLVADCLAEELKDRDLAYVIVNEAGASIYSTSPLGREELPQYDALQRGAISIGRRLLDPLSEMVKIHPANLGVGLYQHDIKAKHLKDSLDAVVESCVNFVAVDVNSASPALLRYVSGMNALTARRVYEYRREHGPFKNREELKKVQGFGEQTFVQAAGFLKVIGGENPLDATWIHPESYDIARRVLEKIGCDVSELAQAVPAPAKKEEPREFAAELVGQEGVGSQESGDGRRETGDGGQEPGAGDQEPGAIAAEAPAMGLQSTEYFILSTQQATTPEVTTLLDPSATTIPETSPPLPLTPSPTLDQPTNSNASLPSPQPPAPSPSVIAERAASVNVEQLAAELGVGTHLLRDILAALMRPALDPRDNFPPPVFRRGIMKLEDLAPGMELSATVLNVVDFGAFVDIGLPDSGLVHISRLADRYIRDPHEVVGVGDVLKVWVVDVDKGRRRVSLTAIAPGSERPSRPPREKRGQRPPRQARPQQGGQSAAQGAPAGGQQGRPQGRRPQGDRPPRQYGGSGRRDQRGRGHAHPKTVERRPTKPKPVKPITKAMEEGKEPMRSFSDLMQLFDKKKQKPEAGEPPPDAASSA